MPDIKYAQTEAVDKGSLKVEVLANRTRRPIEGAKITISYSGKPDSTVEEVSADDSGMSEKLTLDAPPLEYSMEPPKISHLPIYGQSYRTGISSSVFRVFRFFQSSSHCNRCEWRKKMRKKIK